MKKSIKLEEKIKVRWDKPVDPRARTIQLGCKVEKGKLNQFIQEIESLSNIQKEISKDIFVKARYDLESCHIIVYTSGSVVYNPHKKYLEVLEKYCENFYQEIINLQEKTVKKKIFDLIVGQDEVGKGELYGPMITASVAIKPSDLKAFKLMGVKDSKLIKNKEEIKELAFFIEENAVEVNYSLIDCKKFNELIKEMKEEGKNLNDLLAWQHSNALGKMKNELIKKGYTEEKENDNYLVIIDEFDKIKTDERMRMVITENMTVIQHTKAEGLSMAVAAASIVAKNKRNERIKVLEEQYKVMLNGRTVKKLTKHPQANEFLKMVFVKRRGN